MSDLKHRTLPQLISAREECTSFIYQLSAKLLVPSSTGNIRSMLAGQKERLKWINHYIKKKGGTDVSNTMSKDRVFFFISRAGGVCSNKGGFSEKLAVVEAAMDAFNIGEQCAANSYLLGTRLVARPSQFARFIHFRNVLGGTNFIKQMNVRMASCSNVGELVFGSGHRNLIDVSANKAKTEQELRRYYLDVNKDPEVAIEVVDSKTLFLGKGSKWESRENGMTVRVLKDTTLSGENVAKWTQLYKKPSF